MPAYYAPPRAPLDFGELRARLSSDVFDDPAMIETTLTDEVRVRVYDQVYKTARDGGLPDTEWEERATAACENVAEACSIESRINDAIGYGQERVIDHVEDLLNESGADFDIRAILRDIEAGWCTATEALNEIGRYA